MRDALHIAALFFVFSFLATRFPSEIAWIDGKEGPQRSFASFLVLSPAEHTACIEATRPSWQVRSAANGRPSIGRLDAGIPLLDETLPPPENVIVGLPPSVSMGPLDVDAYSFLPPTLGVDEPVFATRVLRADTDHPPEAEADANTAAFSKAHMLSTENSKTLKEIMQ